MHVEIPQTAGGIGRLDLVADDLAAGDDDLITARHPQQGLNNALHKAEVLLIVAGAIGEHTGLIGGGIALVPLDGDNQILPVFSGGGTHLAAHQGHRGITGV